MEMEQEDWESLYHRSLCLSAEFNASLFGVAKRNSLIKIDPVLHKSIH